jgi:hypothetical protein
MHCLRRTLALSIVALLLTGCDTPNGASAALPVNITSGGSENAQLVVNPGGLAFSGIGTSSQITVSGERGSTTLRLSGCDGIVSGSGDASPGYIVITSAAVGRCTLHLVDSAGDGADVTIMVSSLAIPLN